MLPRILQPPQYGTPVADLIIDGLALCCFNRDQKKWEIAFLRDGHAFEVMVKKLDRSGKITDQGGPRLVKNSRLIEILVSNGSAAHFGDFPRGFFKTSPPFSRSDDE